MLSPRFEEWILAAAKESGLKLSSYSLPEEPNIAVNLDPRKPQKLLADLKRSSRMLEEPSRVLKDQKRDAHPQKI